MSSCHSAKVTTSLNLASKTLSSSSSLLQKHWPNFYVITTTTRMKTASGKPRVQDGLLLSEYMLSTVKGLEFFSELEDFATKFEKNGPLSFRKARSFSSVLPEGEENVLIDQ